MVRPVSFSGITLRPSRYTHRGLALWALLLASLTLPALQGCSDSPSDIVEELGEHAKRRKLVQFRNSFSEKARSSLEQQFVEDGLSDAEGWRDLMVGYLGRDRKPPEIVSEELVGEHTAVVRVSKRVPPRKGSTDPTRIIVQELAMVEEDDEWKLALGPMKYKIEDEGGDEKEDEPEKPLEEEPVLELGQKQQDDQPIEDIDLDEF